MRKLVGLCILASCALLEALLSDAAAQERTIFERRNALETGTVIVRRVVYTGEGWRNLRKVRFENFFEGRPSTLRWDAYYICGARMLVYVSTVERMQSEGTSEILGVAPTDDIITPGALVNIQSGVRNVVEVEEVAALLNAMAPMCDAPPSIAVDPERLLLANARDLIWHLEPGRFAREGQVVRFWTERRYVRTATMTMRHRGIDDYTSDVLVLQPGRGHDLFQEEADCRAGTLRLLQSVKYNSAGDVVDDYRSQSTVGSEVVPDSVGEGMLQIVCAIR